MASKCKRGQVEMPNGDCYSERRITKALKNEIAGIGGYGCLPETGPIDRGISVVGKGRNLYATRHGYGRCVRLKELTSNQRMRILERIIKDHMLTADAAGRAMPPKRARERVFPEIKLSSWKGETVALRSGRRMAKIVKARIGPDGKERFDIEDRATGKIKSNVKPSELWFY